MANIIPLKDSAGAQFYPQTHEKAVVDSNGVTLDTKLDAIVNRSFKEAWDGSSTPDVAKIPAGVVVTYNSQSYTGTLAASAATAPFIYMVADGNGNYDRYVSELSGSSYVWKYYGNTEINLSDYTPQDEFNQLNQKVTGDATKRVVWSPGYVNSLGKINNSSVSQFSQPILLRAGEKVTIGTQNTNITIIGSTEADSLAVGDTITVIQKTSGVSQFETYEYTAATDIKIVLCVLASNFTLSFYDDDNIEAELAKRATKDELKVVDGEVNVLDFRSRSYTEFTVELANNVQLYNRFPLSAYAGERIEINYSYTPGIFPAGNFFVYLHYKDGTSSQAYLITPGEPRRFDVVSELVGITAYKSEKATQQGTFTCSVGLLFNNITDNAPLLVPEYYHSDAYLQNKANRIESLAMECAAEADLFAFVTDEHWERNARASVALIQYLAEHVNLEKYISGGDSGDTMANVEISRLRKDALKGKVFPMNGNHEYLVTYSQSGAYNADKLENRAAYAYFMGVDSFVGNIKRGYYYFDDIERRIRYIFLSAFKPGTEEQSGGSYRISAVNGYDQEQLDWFETVALDVPSNWGVIVSTHNIASYSHVGDLLVPSVADSPFAQVCEIMLRFEGDILAVFAGHTHRDGIILLNDEFVGISQNKTGKTIPVIISTCDAYNFSGTEALENRTRGTITEQAFDIDIADFGAKRVHCVRIGAPACLNFAKSGTLQERIMNCTPANVAVGGTTTLVSGLSGTVSWSSFNGNIATVNSSGVVSGVAQGSVFVVATDNTNKIASIFIVKVS